MAGGEESENAILLRAPWIALGRFRLMGVRRIGAFPTTQLAARGAIKQNAFWVRGTGRGLRLRGSAAEFGCISAANWRATRRVSFRKYDEPV